MLHTKCFLRYNLLYGKVVVILPPLFVYSHCTKEYVMDQNLDAVHHKLNVKLSPHVKADDSAKRPTHWIVAVIITLVLGLFVAGSTASLNFEAVFGKSEAGSIKAQLSELFVFLFTLAIIFIWVKFKEGRPFRTVGFLGGGGLKKFGLGFVVGAVLIVLPTATLLLSGQYVHDVSRVGATLGSSALWIVVLLLIVWVVQATTEEIAMRGYLLQTFGRQLPAWVAVLVPAILFAILHIGATPIALVNILLIAIFFSFLSLGQGSIWMAAGIHTGWNMVQGNILGVPVSGIPHSVTIWAFSPATDAPQWLTGGIFGIEASAAATIVLALAAVWSYFYYRRRQAAWEVAKA
jgi:CAAX protease family protein